MNRISAKRSQIRSTNEMKRNTSGSKDMPYTAIRYISDYHIDDIEEATKAMETAGAFDVPGIGSWRIEAIGDKISYLFFPGESSKLGLSKQTALWMQLGKTVKDTWQKKLPGHKFTFVLDADAKPPKGMWSRFRKHKKYAMMLKEFYANMSEEKIEELKKKAKNLVDKATKLKDEDKKSKNTATQ